MAAGEAEVRIVAYCGCALAEAVTEQLARAGLSASMSGLPLIFFDQFTPALLSLVAAEPSIAVALDESSLRVAVAPLLRAGALDVISARATWPERVKALLEHRCAIDRLLASPVVRGNVTGQSAAWLTALRQAVELSQGSASVLLSGATGTGKELLARLIHHLDPRPHKRELVVLDCTTVMAELSGSELFGHERGAFTGALTAREGVIAQAQHGTLFLDEVGELPLPLQAQLLRVIQERTYRRVGADAQRSLDFRLLCATHRDLEQEVRAGRFRADLYYRLAASSLRLPRLDERGADILPLARSFLKQLSDGLLDSFDPLVEEHLLRRSYPGNVRELKQLVGRAYHRWVGPGPLGYAALPEEEWGAAQPSPERELEQPMRRVLASRLSLKEIGRVATDVAVRVALEDAAGNLQRAAAALGVTDRALQLRRAQRAACPLDGVEAAS
jgi:transcriptional regulator with GAF, ATPase, and Fis domain